MNMINFTVMSPLAFARRYFQSSYYYLDDPVTPRVALTSDPAWQRDGPNGTQGPIPADVFPVHVATLHADSDIGESLYGTLKSCRFEFLKRCEGQNMSFGALTIREL